MHSSPVFTSAQNVWNQDVERRREELESIRELVTQAKDVQSINLSEQKTSASELQSVITSTSTAMEKQTQRLVEQMASSEAARSLVDHKQKEYDDALMQCLDILDITVPNDGQDSIQDIILTRVKNLYDEADRMKAIKTEDDATILSLKESREELLVGLLLLCEARLGGVFDGGELAGDVCIGRDELVRLLEVSEGGVVVLQLDGGLGPAEEGLCAVGAGDGGHVEG